VSHYFRGAGDGYFWASIGRDKINITFREPLFSGVGGITFGNSTVLCNRSASYTFKGLTGPFFVKRYGGHHSLNGGCMGANKSAPAILGHKSVLFYPFSLPVSKKSSTVDMSIHIVV